jgi:hypothetical protein
LRDDEVGAALPHGFKILLTNSEGMSMECSIRKLLPENAEAAFGDMNAQKLACEQGREVLEYTTPLFKRTQE